MNRPREALAPAVPGTAATPARVALLGVGTVGRALLARLAERNDPRLSLQFVATSRRRLQATAGLAAAACAEALARSDGPRAAPPSLASSTGAAALPVCEPHDGGGALPAHFGPGDIVVDATASAELAAWHPRWLRQGLHVVSANKLGLGGPLLRQHEIAQLVNAERRYGDAATVGAGLPLLATLRQLRAGGDRIGAIVGVLSGTLAWLFDGYDGREAFSDRVRAAVAQGYAEPDPRVDLSGEDVRRKLLILARTAGYPLESEEVRVDSLLTPALQAAAAGEVDAALRGLDGPLGERAARARGDGRVLRYVARFDAAGARIGLESLAPDDPIAVGRGCDNRVAVWSSRYRERPLQIQGPGAGAGVTAAALLDDLLRVVG
ncbi:MAG TPA: homoserine dehydrogenase [Arenimonas sp.]|uniref:homoserine dehydrogenase n=1 Tax=Arenimonas sp. TaxID=1872635 RepID=UPI002D80210A|nr:homoserine dehydrogenase [Arenimonas sp.]HEU0152082.1 homoserine dehydrogenase [Arenimonas sp.]